MQLHQYVQAIQRSWWIIALTVLSALNAALVSSYLATPMYKTTTRLLVSPGPSLLASQDRDVLQSISTLDKRSIIATYAEVMSSRYIFDEARTALQFGPGELSGYLAKAVVLPDASALEITVQGPNPQITALLANEVGQQSIEYIKNRYQVYDISILDPATAPGQPFSPRPSRDAGVAVILGLALGVVLALLREQLPTLIGTFGKRSETVTVQPPLVKTQQSFQQKLEEELAQSQSQGLSIGLVQIDGLSELENLPISAIQRLLEQAMQILRHEFGEDVMVERWDNDTFVILLPKLSGSVATNKLERVQQALAQPIELEQAYRPILLRPHIGVTAYRGHESASTLINQAKTALHLAYQNGRKTILFSADKQTISALS